ncbi:MAG: hypothetical protein OQJ97_11395 [Rhodospirillales bacterium]|nr:hypothetical protein [Rhodospirillales bacterium]
MFPGTILMGAQSRLLPPSLPFRFFIAAAVFHIFVWVVLFLGAEDAQSFIGGPGLPLGAIHLLTLGVFVMTAIGASFQLLTVATGAAHKWLWACKLAWWLYLPGILILIHGFTSGDHHVQVGGAFLTIAALVVYIVVVGDILARSNSLKMALSHTWVGLLSLIALFVLGFLLIVDFEHGILPEHSAIGMAHLILAVFGFMGMLTFGFSHILVPMFALSPAPPEKPGFASFEISVGALILAVVGTLSSLAVVQFAAIILGLVAAGMHIWTMNWSLKNGMRKKLGLSFVMVKAGWVMLIVTLLIGALAVIDTAGDNVVTLFGFLALFGWLLTFLTGILQRVIPFLASMNMNKKGVKAPRLSEMASETSLKIHAVCHGIAVLFISLGIVLNQTLFIQGGAISGVIGSIGFLWFTLAIVKSYRTYHNIPEAPKAAPSETTTA